MSSINSDLVALVRKLACAESALHDRYDAHLINNGEILPTILIEEFAMRFVSLYESSINDQSVDSTRARQAVLNIANFLGAILSGGSRLWKEHIRTLFLENLGHAERYYISIEQSLWAARVPSTDGFRANVAAA